MRVSFANFVFCEPISVAASFSGHCLLIWTDRLSQIPLVYGSLSFGRNQHILSHITPRGLQAQDWFAFRHCLGLLLYVLDHYPLFRLPRHHGDLCATGGTGRPRNESTVALAYDFHTGALCSLCPESKVVVRSIHANHQNVVCQGRGGAHRVKRLIKNRRKLQQSQKQVSAFELFCKCPMFGSSLLASHANRGDWTFFPRSLSS